MMDDDKWMNNDDIWMRKWWYEWMNDEWWINE